MNTHPETTSTDVMSSHFPFNKSSLKQALAVVVASQRKQWEVADQSCPGLHAVIYPSGKITFFSRLYWQGKPMRKRLGFYPTLDIHSARTRHHQLQQSVVEGINPITADRAFTLNDYFDDYYCSSLAGKKRSLVTDQSRYNTHVRRSLGRQPLDAITPVMIDQLLQRLRKTYQLQPATINRYLELLRGVFNHAIAMDMLQKNPTRNIPRLPQHNRPEVFMSQSDIAAFVLAAEADEAPVAATLLIVLVMTGARLGEGLNMRWEHLDLQRGTWFLPTQKSGKPGTIYLSHDVVNRLVALNPDASTRSGYVFQGKQPGQALARPIRVFNRICQRADLCQHDDPLKPRFRIHDLRHAWCSAQSQQGVPLEVIRAGARHSSVNITTRYVHHHAADIRAANDQLAHTTQRINRAVNSRR